MSIKQNTYLVVGAGGALGRRVSRALLSGPPERTVRIGVRGGVNGKHAVLLRELASAGAAVVDVDLGDPAGLERACAGVGTVVSTVQGAQDVIVEGQGRLLEACLAAGVDRLVPSDFSLDQFALGEGENWNCDLRRAFDRRVTASGIGHVFLLNGMFMDVLLSPFLNLFDAGARTLSFWGDGETAIDLTSMDDVAAYLAAVLADASALNRVVEVVGDRCTMREIADAIEKTSAQTVRLVSRGSIEAGYAELERMKRDGAEYMQVLPLMYVLPMLNGKARLRHVENERYPAVRPTSIQTFLQQQGA